MEHQPPPPAYPVHRQHVEYQLMLEGPSRDEGSTSPSRDEGSTDLSSTLENGYFQVTRVRYPPTFNASQLCRALKTCRMEKVVDCHMTDGCNILIERIECTVPQFFKGRLDWWQKNEGPEGKRWCLSIKDDFYYVYGNIILGLKHAYSLGYYCGKLTTDGVSVTIVDRKTKLSFLQFGGLNGENDFTAGVQKDMRELSNLMCRTLLLHREDKSETHLDTERIPKELVTFIRKLPKVNRFERDYLEWLLDDSAFWTGVQKSTFMRKLWDRMYSLQTIDSEHLNIYMGRWYPDWESRLKLDDLSRQVKEHIEEDRRKHFERTHTPYMKEKAAMGIAHIYRGCLEHYDSKTNVANRKGKEKVSEIADTILSKGVCSELRMACEWYWWHTEEGPHDRDEQLAYLLSKKDF